MATDNSALLALLDMWRRDLATAKAAVREKEIAIHALEQTLSGGGLPLQPVYGKPPKRITLAMHMRSAVVAMGEQEWTIGDVHAALVGNGVELKAQEPKARMAKVVAKWLDRGEAIRVFEGAGSIPHRYKATPALITGEDDEEEGMEGEKG